MRSDLATPGSACSLREAGRIRLLLVAVAAVVAAAAVHPGNGAPGRREVAGATYFLSVCHFSHRSWDDPIVYPRKPGLSHNHTFLGNVSTNAYSTVSSLRAAGTTCEPQTDTAAYWAPTLLRNGEPVLPLGANVYYRRLVTSPVKPFPPGLRMVAGDSRAHLPQSLAVTYWDCGLVKTTLYGSLRRAVGSAGVRPGTPQLPGLAAASAGVPDCPATTTLQLHVNFPDCWNGKSLDSTDHKAHMTYSKAGSCPAAFRVPVPAISLVLRYKPPGPGNIMLSSGGQHSGHADFINTWNEQALKKLVDNCLNENHDCGIAAAKAPDTP